MKRLATDLPSPPIFGEGEHNPDARTLAGISVAKVENVVPTRNGAQSGIERMLAKGSVNGTRLSHRAANTTTKTYGVHAPHMQPMTAKNVPGQWTKSMGRTRVRETREERDLKAEREAADEYAALQFAGKNVDAVNRVGRDLLAAAIAARSAAIATGDARAAQRAREAVKRAEALIKFKGGELL